MLAVCPAGFHACEIEDFLPNLLVAVPIQISLKFSLKLSEKFPSKLGKFGYQPFFYPVCGLDLGV